MEALLITSRSEGFYMTRLKSSLCSTVLFGISFSNVAVGQTPPELILGRPTDQSITLGVRADAGEVYVEYGTDGGALTESTEPVSISAEPLKIVLAGLLPNTRYYYRVLHRLSGEQDFLPGAVYRFMTQRSRGEPFTFTITSDSHQGYQFFYDEELYYITLANIRADEPDLHLDLGDAISLDNFVETEETVAVKYLDQRRAFAEIGHSASVFLVLGNHENEEGWNLDDTGDYATSLPVLGANARKKYFVNPIPDQFYTGNLDDAITEISGDHLKENYYAFEWGDALFVAIDPFWYTMRKPYAGGIGGERQDEEVGNRWDWTLGMEQYEWLRETLESSDAKYKFVFSHQLAGGTQDYSRGGALGATFCEWGGYDTDGETWMFDVHRPDMITPIHDLMVANGVDIFFHGHDHVFVTEQRDGVIYQECPHAANDNYGTGFGSNQQDYEGELVENSGHVRVTVGAEEAQVEYIRAYLPGDGSNGELAASYPVEAKPTNTRPTAQDDQAQTFAGRAVAIDVLGNDIDADGDELEVIGVSQPMHGRAVHRFSDVYYEPEPGYCTTGAPDSFRYSVRDGRGGSHTAVVEVEVLCNTAPVAEDDAVALLAGESIEIDVLSNDVDAEDELDSSTLEVVAAPATGQAEVTTAGTVLYQALAGFTGADSFTYQICDSLAACAQATVTVTVSCDQDVQCQPDSACDVGQCQAGACVVAPLDCDDGVACTEDRCVEGACENLPSNDVCSTDGACSVGSCAPAAGGADELGCVYEPVVCDDGNPCTEDACVAELGCTTQVVSGSCDDGNPCTVADACVEGLCLGAALDCSVLDEECRVGACEPTVPGYCIAVPVPDGEACSNGTCIAGECRSGTVTSNEGDAGTDAGADSDAASDAEVPVWDEPTSEETQTGTQSPDTSGSPTATNDGSGGATSAESSSSADETSERPDLITSGDTSGQPDQMSSGETSSEGDSETSAEQTSSETSERSSGTSELTLADAGAVAGGVDGGPPPIEPASGCGCAVGERSVTSVSAYWWLAALAALAFRPRRRR